MQKGRRNEKARNVRQVRGKVRPGLRCRQIAEARALGQASLSGHAEPAAEDIASFPKEVSCRDFLELRRERL